MKVWAILASVLAAALIVFGTSSALAADEPSAQSLFEQAVSLMARGDYALAHAKLDESQRIDPSVGTLVKLSECEEKLQQLVAAGTHLAQALELAETRNDARLDAVRQRKERIELITPKLRIVRPPPDVAVAVDGVAVKSESFDFPFAIDVGAHEVVASAPRRIAWRSRVIASLDRTTVVVVPSLVDDAPASAPLAPSTRVTTTTSSSSPWKTAGWITGGAGVVGLGVGAVAGVVALVNKSQAHCDSNDVCDSGSTSGVKSTALVADVAFLTGGALLASGAAMILLAPKGAQKSSAQLTVAPGGANATGCQVVLGGVW